MFLEQRINEKFNSVVSHVTNTYDLVDCSGAGMMVIHNDKIVVEEYWGKHSKEPDARPIQEDSQFHVASVRKSYIGFALAYAVHNGYIESIDDEVAKYLPGTDAELFNKIKIRHLLTHTHGLNTQEGMRIRPSPIQTILSALDSHQILPYKRLTGLEFLHHRRLGLSPDPEGLFIFITYYSTVRIKIHTKCIPKELVKYVK